jgi:hypothetical protein
MNPTPPRTTGLRTRVWTLLGFLALALVAGLLFQMSSRPLEDTGSQSPAPSSAARLQLELRDGQFHRPGSDVPFTGWVTDYFKDGTVKLRSAVVDGRLHGESEGWFTNRVLELREYFQRGHPHGTRTTWHANGQKRSEGELVAGEQQGLYRQWHEDGSLAVVAEFKDGKPHGLSVAWHPSGFLKTEALMKQGEVQSRHTYADGVQREPTLRAKLQDVPNISSAQ